MKRLQLRRLVREAFRGRTPLLSIGETRRAAAWARSAFADFTVTAPDSKQLLLVTVADEGLRLSRLARHLDGEESRTQALARALAASCTRLDTGRVWHESSRLRSYVDITVQTKAMKAFIEMLAGKNRVAPDALSLSSLLLTCVPGSRPALLAHAELLIEANRPNEALEVIQQALRIQPLCITAQQLLGQAQTKRRAGGEGERELDGMNYDLSDRFCTLPFTNLATGFQGDAFACCCPAWLPFPTGNILKAASVDEVWNSEQAVEIRRSIHDGDFSYCSHTLCPYIAAQKLPRKAEITDPTLRRYIDERTVVLETLPSLVQFNHDPTCNLACPSCRTDLITASAEERNIYALAEERVLMPLLKRVNGQLYISGGGEVFSSKHNRSILSALNRDAFPGLYLHLITNGQLATPERWARFPKLPEMIRLLSVSIDASRPATYERLRTPGKWAPLMENMAYMAEMRRSGRIRGWQINFVVQEANFREMLEFVDLGEQLGVDEIWFQRLTNYGTFDEETFSATDVTSPAHPDHQELLHILRNPRLDKAHINIDMLMPLLPEVVASDILSPFLSREKRPGDGRTILMA